MKMKSETGPRWPGVRAGDPQVLGKGSLSRGHLLCKWVWGRSTSGCKGSINFVTKENFMNFL